MFGYVTINRAELKMKDYDVYQSYYCGLCGQLKKRHGFISGLVLTYDMTFLAVLLSGLYEEQEHRLHKACFAHPCSRHTHVTTKALSYAADMNLMLAYHNLMDDWQDERKLKSLILMRRLRHPYLATAARYPRQQKAICGYLKALHACEAGSAGGLDEAAGLTGRMLSEIFAWKEDMWCAPLRSMGFFMGKFIYLMDAYEDVERDEKSGCYNPFLSTCHDADFDEQCLSYLTMMMAEAARSFEMLPVIKHGELLRNIIYSGCFQGYARVRKRRGKEKEDKFERNFQTLH